MVISWQLLIGVVFYYIKGGDNTKYIYKITNLKNGKIYIGQSNNPQKRFKSHMSCRTSKIFSDDIKRYGVDNFSMEVIKKCDDNFRQDEIDTIKEYRSLGYSLYNIKSGGEEPPTFYGENNWDSKYSDQQRDDIIYYLKNTYYDYKYIAELTKTSKDFVNKVNNGKRPKEGVEYPIRTETWSDILSKKIIEMLQTTDLTQREIAKKIGTARSTVTMINTGKNRHNDNIEYPIRKK